ncbi:hypothetical protein GF373_14385 [bacterium]|nr:hypothetical protein [bacterium]
MKNNEQPTYPNQQHTEAFRRIPSPRFWAMQGFLFFVWDIVSRSLLRDANVPGLNYEGMLILRNAVLLVFLLLWLCAGITFLLHRWGAKRGKSVVECALAACFIGVVLWLAQVPLFETFQNSVDHLTHFTLAQLTWANLMAHAQLEGWCSAIGCGIPLNELYPPGGTLFSCLARMVTFGIFSHETTYSLTVLAAYLFFAFAIYHAMRKSFGPTAALLWLVLALLDSGSWFYGYLQFFDVGMWPMGVGLGFSILAFAECASSRFPRSKWHLLLAGFALAAAWLFHPLNFIVNAFWIVILLAAHTKNWVESRYANGNTHTRRDIAGLAGFILAVFLGAGLSAFYWLPFVFSHGWMELYGTWGRISQDIGKAMIDGTVFPHALPWITFFGIVGLFWGLVSKNRFTVCLSVFTAWMLFLSTDTLRNLFDLPFYQSIFAQLQTERFLGIAKITTVMMVAGLFGKAFEYTWHRAEIGSRLFATGRWIWAWSPTPSTQLIPRMISDLSLLIITVMLLLPLLVFTQNLWHGVIRWHLQPAESIYIGPHNSPKSLEDFIAVNQSHQKRVDSPSLSYYLDDPLPNHRLLSMENWMSVSSIVYANTPVLIPGYMPAVLLNTRPIGYSPWLAEIAKTQYALDFKHAPKLTATILSNFELIEENNHLALYQRKPSPGPGYKIHGSATIKRIPTKTRTLRFQCSGVTPGTTLRLGISRYRKWHAYLNGAPVTTLMPPQPNEPPFAEKLLGVPLENGTLEFRYEADWFDVLARNITLVSLVLALFILFVQPHWITWLTNNALNPWLAGLTATGIGILVLTGFLAFLSIPLLKTKSVDPSWSQLDFKGRFGDYVHSNIDIIKWKRTPDGQADLCFSLRFYRSDLSNDIISLDMYQVDASGRQLGRNHWTTWPDWKWKIAVMGPFGGRCDQNDGNVILPDTLYQELNLFIADPFYGQIPRPFHVKCVAKFEDGSIREFFSFKK